MEDNNSLIPINHERALLIDGTQTDENWIRSRIGRIGMSRLGNILIFCKTEEQKIRYANIICGLIHEEFTEEAKERMRIGLEFEDVVRQSYANQIGQKILTISSCIFRENPIFSGSVDGILENGDLIEIKIIEKDIPEFYSSDFSEIPLWYYYQVQGNMFITDSTRCHFVCYSRKSGKMYVRIVPYNHERFINEVYIPCCKYHKKYVMPLLIKNGIKTPYEDYEERVNAKLNQSNKTIENG